jgi:hypothetical protein
MIEASALMLDWPAVVGGGFVVSVLFLALVERLRRTFVARAELEQAMRPLDRVTERVEALREMHAAQAAVLEQMLQRLDRLDSAGISGPGRARRRGG